MTPAHVAVQLHTVHWSSTSCLRLCTLKLFKMNLQRGGGREASLTAQEEYLCAHKIIATEPLNLLTRVGMVKTTGHEVKGTREDRNADKGSERRNQGICRKGPWRIWGGDGRCEKHQAHLLIAHVPIGLVPEAEHLPHHDPKAPHIAGRGEDPVGDGFGGCPTDGDLPSLTGHMGQKAVAPTLQAHSSPTLLNMLFICPPANTGISYYFSKLKA